MICSDNRIKSEFEQIKNSFLCNGYLKEIIVDTINKNVNKFRNNIQTLGPSKCRVYVRLALIGYFTQLIADKVSSYVTRCYNTTMVRINFMTTRDTFLSIHKDVITIFQQSNLI